MKNVKLVIIMVAISVVAKSQNSSSFEFSAQVGSSFREFGKTGNGNTGDIILDNQDRHRAKVNYRIEVSYNKSIAKNMFFRTGVNYSSLNYYTWKLTDLKWPSEHDSNGGWEPDPNLAREINHQIDIEDME